MKCIKIYVEKKNKKTGRKNKDICWVRDNLATTKFGDPNEAFKVYQAKRANGSKISWTRGLTFEKYDMKMKPLAKKIEKEVNEMAEETKIEVTIKLEETTI